MISQLFNAKIPQPALDDLRQRLEHTRWPEAPGGTMAPTWTTSSAWWLTGRTNMIGGRRRRN